MRPCSIEISMYLVINKNHLCFFLPVDIGYVGGVPFSILEPVLKKATARQLLTIEDYNCVSFLIYLELPIVHQASAVPYY